ncbi:AAA family ATPase, partial [Arthrobacter sp. H14]|uniref:AAA family ATPase n=1 Tax=Arthrobacter sp. H14 TaxID=1312959 RepID=UPI00056107B9
MDTDGFNASSGGMKSLVGRSAVVGSIVEFLTLGGIGMWVVGEAGVGKSAVAKAVEEFLGSGFPLVRLSASPSLASVPFGALAPLLKEISVEDISSPLAVIRSVTRSLRRLQDSGPLIPIVIVDDAHVLDGSSAAILAQVVSAGNARLFALSRPVPGIPAEIVDLWREGLVSR